MPLTDIFHNQMFTIGICLDNLNIAKTNPFLKAGDPAIPISL